MKRREGEEGMASTVSSHVQPVTAMMEKRRSGDDGLSFRVQYRIQLHHGAVTAAVDALSSSE